MTRRLLGISGALRRASTNTLLMREALRRLRERAAPAGIEVETAEGDLRLPLYDGDLETEQGLPDPATRLIARIREADGVIISTPEYNKNLSGVLKNALDWVSRDKPMAFADTPVAILSATAGRAGGERAQFSLRHCLTPFGARVLPGPEVTIADSAKAFDAEGRLKDPASVELLDGLLDAFEEEIRRRGG